MNSEAPVNAGHTFANAAEEYEDRDDWTKAIEAHNNAAEQFQKALEYTEDAEAGKSLRLLMANHIRKAKDLERKLLKIKSDQEQQQRRRNEQQQRLQEQRQQLKQVGSATHDYYQQRTISCHTVGASGSKGKETINMNGLLNALPITDHGNLSLQVRMDKDRSSDISHHGTIGESYAVLSTDNEEDDDDDASDPFNKFLQVVETLVEQLSNPVAFASAPLSEDDIPTPYHQKLLSMNDPNGASLDRPSLDSNDMSTMMESFFFVPDHRDDGMAAMSHVESNLSSSSSSSSTQDKSALQVENEQLKRHIDQLSRRVLQLEKTAEESHMLKSSILQFRNDVQRQAKRIMQTHDSSSMRSSSVALLGNSAINGVGLTHNSYPRHPGMNPSTTGSTAELVTRLKEVEDENRRLKDQVEKQQLLMNKYQERWEKLKESAKKRRAQPPDMTNSSGNSSNVGGVGHVNNNNLSPEYHRSYSSRPPALLRSLAQQSASHHPPFASSSLARASRVASNDPYAG